MCGRYYVSEEMKSELERIVANLERKMKGVAFTGDVVPSNHAAILVSDNDNCINAKIGKWGYHSDFSKRLIINARAETLNGRKMFAASLENGRCVIPAAGFYEWDKSKNKFTFTRKQSDILYLAGICRQREQEDQFVILTTQANASMERVHHRMPLILDKEQMQDWLMRDEQTDTLLRTVPMELDGSTEMEQMRLDFI